MVEIVRQLFVSFFCTSSAFVIGTLFICTYPRDLLEERYYQEGPSHTVPWVVTS